MSINYKPVITRKAGPYHGAALVGTHSAVIGWSFDDPKLRKGLLGFAVRRTDMDPDTKEVLRRDWLGGYKRFKETDDGRQGDVRSDTAPFQRFRWNDYSVRPDRAYRYEVFPMRGTPANPTRKERAIKFEIRPSAEDTGDLGVYVNRGVTAAKAYFHRFGNTPPDEVPNNAAYAWLSRGLKESLLGFIGAARSGEALHVAIYEFFDHEIAKAFKDARGRGVDVHIVHDAKKGKHSTDKNFAVLKKFGLKSKAVSTPRTTVNISHNKIVIRLVGGVPREVWTGSANFSENAFNFQTNTALVVRDADAVQHFEDYFQDLLPNPSKADSKTLNRALMTRANAMNPRLAHKTFFSPVRKNDILDASVDLISNAKSAVFVSAPFGVANTMVDSILGNAPGLLEYGLVNATAQKKIAGLKRRNTRFFPPKRMKTYLGETWDAKAFGAHKIHAKSIVVDPLSKNPKVLIGSANFSKPSCQDNDENAMLITGDSRLAAILATEFMRMYDHYKARYWVDFFHKKNQKIRTENKARAAQGKQPKKLLTMSSHLASDESWSKTAFDPKAWSHKFQDRIVFSRR